VFEAGPEPIHAVLGRRKLGITVALADNVPGRTIMDVATANRMGIERIVQCRKIIAI
jgi:hypothetical protein